MHDHVRAPNEDATSNPPDFCSIQPGHFVDTCTGVCIYNYVYVYGTMYMYMYQHVHLHLHDRDHQRVWPH
jgi:hypothetical protein